VNHRRGISQEGAKYEQDIPYQESGLNLASHCYFLLARNKNSFSSADRLS
jgi:hypothetical protein